MKLSFTKMEGTGNDYIYVNCLGQRLKDPEQTAVRLSDRRFGIGGDGLVLILPSDRADFRMRIFNADGSEAEICGNAARCIGRYVLENELLAPLDSKGGTGAPKALAFLLETGAGIRRIKADGENIWVDMGLPEYGGSVEVQGFRGERVSMGNPHFVVFTDEITDQQVLGQGPLIEKAAIFPQNTNVEFARLLDRENLAFRVWERGSGETLSCGSGACAVFAAARKAGVVGLQVDCRVPGGTLKLVEAENGHIFLSGPARTVFSGEAVLNF